MVPCNYVDDAVSGQFSVEQWARTGDPMIDRVVEYAQNDESPNSEIWNDGNFARW